MKEKIYIQDVTLRDGMHAIKHQYGIEHVKKIAKALDEAKVDAIEIAHGDGISGSSFNYGFGAHTDKEWIAAVADEVSFSKLTTLILPGIAVKEDLDWAYAMGIRSVRVATHCTEADVSKQHIEHAKNLGMDTIGFLMMSHMNTPTKLAEQACSANLVGVFMCDIIKNPMVSMPRFLACSICCLDTSASVQ